MMTTPLAVYKDFVARTIVNLTEDERKLRQQEADADPIKVCADALHTIGVTASTFYRDGLDKIRRAPCDISLVCMPYKAEFDYIVKMFSRFLAYDLSCASDERREKFYDQLSPDNVLGSTQWSRMGPGIGGGIGDPKFKLLRKLRGMDQGDQFCARQHQAKRLKLDHDYTNASEVRMATLTSTIFTEIASLGTLFVQDQLGNYMKLRQLRAFKSKIVQIQQQVEGMSNRIKSVIKDLRADIRPTDKARFYLAFENFEERKTNSAKKMFENIHKGIMNQPIPSLEALQKILNDTRATNEQKQNNTRLMTADEYAQLFDKMQNYLVFEYQRDWLKRLYILYSFLQQESLKLEPVMANNSGLDASIFAALTAVKTEASQQIAIEIPKYRQALGLFAPFEELKNSWAAAMEDAYSHDIFAYRSQNMLMQTSFGNNTESMEQYLNYLNKVRAKPPRVSTPKCDYLQRRLIEVSQAAYKVVEGEVCQKIEANLLDFQAYIQQKIVDPTASMLTQVVDKMSQTKLDTMPTNLVLQCILPSRDIAYLRTQLSTKIKLPDSSLTTQQNHYLNTINAFLFPGQHTASQFISLAQCIHIILLCELLLCK